MAMGGLISLPQESKLDPAQHLSIYSVTVELPKFDFQLANLAGTAARVTLA
jgi:hypothetical protein